MYFFTHFLPCNVFLKTNYYLKMVRKYCATKIIYLVLVYRISQYFPNNNVAVLCAKNALDGFSYPIQPIFMFGKLRLDPKQKKKVSYN